MYLYEYVKVTGVISDEKLETLLTSTAEEPKHIESLCFVEVTGTLQRDAIVRAYIERERILDIPYYNMLEDMADDIRLESMVWIPIGEDLPVGQALKVGQLSGTTASDFDVVVRYTVT